VSGKELRVMEMGREGKNMKGSLNEIDFHSEHGKEGSHGMA
jgi:hypothetical protein